MRKLLIFVPAILALAACAPKAEEPTPVTPVEAPVQFEHYRADGLPVDPELNSYFNFVIKDQGLHRALTPEEMFAATMAGSSVCTPETYEATINEPGVRELRAVLSNAQCAALTAHNPLGFPVEVPQESSETASEPVEEQQEDVGPGYLDPDAYNGGQSSGETQLEWLCSQGIADPSEC